MRDDSIDDMIQARKASKQVKATVESIPDQLLNAHKDHLNKGLTLVYVTLGVLLAGACGGFLYLDSKIDANDQFSSLRVDKIYELMLTQKVGQKK